MHEYHKKRLIGQIFGKLTVLEVAGVTKGNKTIWKCICECGNFKTVRSDCLKKGLTKSCGCLMRRKHGDNPNWKGYGEISLLKWNQIKRDAESRKLEFDITIEQIWDLFLKQDRKCALSGIELKFKQNSYDCNANASLDRIDSLKGYTIDNVQWIDKRINFMKQDFPEKEFLNICKTITEYNAVVA